MIISRINIIIGPADEIPRLFDKAWKRNVRASDTRGEYASRVSFVGISREKLKKGLDATRVCDPWSVTSPSREGFAAPRRRSICTYTGRLGEKVRRP